MENNTHTLQHKSPTDMAGRTHAREPSGKPIGKKQTRHIFDRPSQQ